MNDPQDDRRIRELLGRLPKASIPTQLVASIEAETLFKRPWWESDLFQTRWLPALIGAATVMGALWLSKVQQHPHVGVPIPMAAAPSPDLSFKHAFLPPQEPSSPEKGDSRDN